MRWRPGLFGRPAYARGRTQPYREPWLKYHFWAGLIGGVFAPLWATNGFLSNDPGGVVTVDLDRRRASWSWSREQKQRQGK